MSNVTILDATGIDALPPPATDRERRRRLWVAALSRFGPRHFIDNADVAAKGIVVDGHVLPLVLADCASANTDVCSSYSHYIAYTLEEFSRRHRRVPSVIPRTVMLPLRAILSAGHIDRAVFANNWLLATNPCHGLSAAEVAAVTAYLTATYPDSAIVFRSLNRAIDPQGIEQLRKNGYRLVRSRRVYLLDARNMRYLEHVNARIDRRLLERTSYQIVGDPEVLRQHADRLAELYRGLYLDKHSRLNPQLNERFFALTVTERVLTYRALMQNGRIDGFIAFHEGDDAMTGAVLGYDRRLPIEAGLYRMLFALLMVEGAKRKVLINLSAGADRFKALRGGMPVEEYDAVFDRHLLPTRRLAWSTLRVATGIWWRVRRPEVSASTTRRPAGVDWDRTWGKTWKPDPGNPWHQYQAGACAAWTFGGDVVPQTHTGARVLKTDAFDEACGFDPLSTLVGAVPRFLMDISPHIASAALRARSPICGVCVTDIRTLAFHPATFDFIFSPSTIDHFGDGRDISAALRELWAVLRPGGRLLITLDNPSNPLVRARNALCRVAGPVNPLIPFPMGRTLSRAGLVKVLGRTQFEVVRSGYVVHAPRVLALWLGEWTARRGNKRSAAWLLTVLERLDRGLAVLPTRPWTAHYVIADCYRPLQNETAPSIKERMANRRHVLQNLPIKSKTPPTE